MGFIWETCAVGHDLTVPDALLYLRGGSRVCKLCHFQATGKNKMHRHTF